MTLLRGRDPRSLAAVIVLGLMFGIGLAVWRVSAGGAARAPAAPPVPTAAPPRSIASALDSMHVVLDAVPSGVSVISRTVAEGDARRAPDAAGGAVLDTDLGVVRGAAPPLANCACWILSVAPPDPIYTVDGKRHERTLTLVFLNAKTGTWVTTIGYFDRAPLSGR